MKRAEKKKQCLEKRMHDLCEVQKYFFEKKII